MKVIAGLGKLLSTLFWCVVLANLISPFSQPFSQLLTLAGLAVLGLHLTELVLFNSTIRTQPRVAIERARVVAFGMFHLWSLPAAERVLVAAPLNTEETAPCAS